MRLLLPIAASLGLALALPASAATTLTFQQGIGAYAGTQDTELSGGSPDTVLGVTESTMSVDADNGGTVSQDLIRFDNLFGNAAGQIKSGDQILSARITLNITSEGSGFTVYDMLKNWSQTSATWNSLGNGIQIDGVDAAMTEVAHFGMNNSSKNVTFPTLTIDVTSSLQKVQTGQLPGYGWAFIPFTPYGTNGIDFDTSESIANRPLLTVDIAPVPEPESYALMLAGLGLIGAMARRRKVA